jgi:hypothetical protein
MSKNTFHVFYVALVSIGLVILQTRSCQAQNLQGIASGLRARWYASATPLYSLPSEADFERLTPSLLNTVPNLDYAVVNRGTSGLNAVSGSLVNRYSARFDGYVTIDSGGTWIFCTASDDGSRLFLGGSLLVNNDGQHQMFEVCANKTLPPGQHAIVVDFFENEGGQGLIVSWSGPRVARQVVPPSALRCTVCAAGAFHSDTSQNASCIACFRGNFCPSAGIFAPVPCEVGQYQDVAGSSGCKACSSGSFCSTKGLVIPNGDCPVGSFCPAGASSPTVCPVGSYCEATRMPKPVPCPSGNYCPSSGMTSSGTTCKVGSYCPSGSANPVACPSGNYCPAPGLPNPVLCPEGSFCPNEGMTNHVPCPTGSTCPAGSVQPSEASDDEGLSKTKILEIVLGVVGSVVATIIGILIKKKCC